MFKRRQPRPVWRKLLRLFWPRGGWHRSSRYIFHRVARIPGSPYSITAGFACGAAISFTPFIGLHFVLAAILAWTLRANIVTSAIGTIVGNPWTFPFIWVWIYKFGTWLPITEIDGHKVDMNFAVFFSDVTRAVLVGDMGYLMETAAPVMWPMLVGSIPTGIVIWILTYFLLKPLVSAYQHRRRRRHTVRAEQAAEMVQRNAAASGQSDQD